MTSPSTSPANCTNSHGKYQHKVCFVDSPSKNLICPLCQNIFFDPVISECGHTFCRQCITGDQFAICTIHRDRKLSVVVDNLAVREQVGELTVRCIFGVQFVAPVSNGQDLNVHPTYEHGSWITLNDGCPAIVKFSEKSLHEQNCDYRPLPCPNSDDCPKIRKKDLPAHLSQCHSRRCAFHSYGCSFSGNEMQLLEHSALDCRFEPLKDCLSQINNRLIEQSEMIAQKDEEIGSLRSLIAKLSSRVGELEEKYEALHETTARTELDVVDMRRDIDSLLDETAGNNEQSSVENSSSASSGVKELRCAGTFVGHEGPIWCLAASNDCIFSGSTDTTIKVWDVIEMYQCIKTLEGHSGIVLCLHVFEQKLYSGSADRCFNVWNLENFSLMRRIIADSNPVCALVCANDKIFTGSLMKIKIWDAKTVTLIKELDGNSWFRAFAVCGRQLYAGSRQAVFVWDIETFEFLRKLDLPGSSVYSLTLLDQQVLFCGTCENHIYMWDLWTNELLVRLNGHSGVVYALATLDLISSSQTDFSSQSPDSVEEHGIIVSGSHDRSLKVWKCTENRHVTCMQTVSRHGGSVTCLLSFKGRLYSGSIDSTIKVWCY